MPWPARIQNIGKNNKTINVYFFGTGERGTVGSKSIIPFSRARETIRLMCLRSPKQYIKAVKEIEKAYGVPKALSCLIKLNSIQ